MSNISIVTYILVIILLSWMQKNTQRYSVLLLKKQIITLLRFPVQKEYDYVWKKLAQYALSVPNVSE